ncbi:uncharacterized protein TNCV_3112731 [Trichonephila clavipes]|nr:uncharacterized protein TNCV_3112731 [Trichonephila clavipes]
MDDNATCHRTLSVQDCLDSEGIQRLVWPARSPDLNPIENVWDALGRQVAGRKYPPTKRTPSSVHSQRNGINCLNSCWIMLCKDEVEKLAYQLNEEAERTERPIRRLSKVMYGSTCADMQVDVMGECLSSIKHVVGKSYPGFSSGRPRGTTPADDRYLVLQTRRNRRQTTEEIARHTTQVTGRPISRFTVARRLHGGGLFARRPVRCVPLTPAHREGVLCGAGNIGIGETMNGDEYSLQMSADSV